MNAIKRSALLCIALALTACAARINDATMKDGKPGHIAVCGGTARAWDVCYDGANKTCANGFTILDRDELQDQYGVRRTLYFRCKA